MWHAKYTEKEGATGAQAWRQIEGGRMASSMEVSDIPRSWEMGMEMGSSGQWLALVVSGGRGGNAM